MDPDSYAPRSPDLSGLSQPPDPTNPYNTYDDTTYTNNPYAAYPPPTSIPHPYTTYGAESLPPPQYNVPSDDHYMPDAPIPSSKRGRKPPSSRNHPPTQDLSHALPIRDPTRGVTLKTQFPVARIKRIMQADEDIGKVAQVTPHVVSRALELFMIRLITASTEQAQGGPGGSKGSKRILCQHMKRAIMSDDTFDFLHEIAAKVPDAPTRAKKEATSESDEAKPVRKRGKKRKDSGDDF